MSAPEPARVQRKRSKGWRMPPNTVSVTRPGEFGNPFIVSKAHDRTAGTVEWWVEVSGGSMIWRHQTKEEAVAASVKAFAAWVELPQQRRLRDRATLALRGKNVACFCGLDSPCHGDVWLRMANAPAAAQEAKTPAAQGRQGEG